MGRKRFIIELGMGVDLHGEDSTVAACRAVTDAVSNTCLSGLSEVLTPEDVKNLEIEIRIAAPDPETVDVEKVKELVPLGERTVSVVEGGMTAKGLMVEKFGANRDRIFVANAAITVYVGK